MADGQGPTTARRRLRMRLKGLRDAKGYSLDRVRKEMEWSISKLIRIENGGVSITVNDLKILLDYYGVVDQEEVAPLLELARLSRQRHWASAYREHVSSSYMDLLGYEDDSRLIRQFHPLVVPALLQTRAYAEAIVAATAVGATREDIEARVHMRMARQRRVFAGVPPRVVQVAFDDSALRPIGDEDLMKEQIAHLTSIIDRSVAEIIIVPSTVGPHLGLTGAFILLEFSQDPDIVCLDSAPGDVTVVEDAKKIERFRETFEKLQRMGLRGAEARDRICRVAKAMT